METKGNIRKNILRLRDELSEEERREKSKIIIKKLLDISKYKEAEIILAYASYKSEVQTEELIIHALKNGKKLYCPKVKGAEMEFYRITSMSDFVSGYKGIKEPKGSSKTRLDSAAITRGNHLMIMPGAVFDKEGNRIGYGKGYYDKYIEKHNRLYRAAICFEFQVQNNIPNGKYDKGSDIIITEESIYSF